MSVVFVSKLGDAYVVVEGGEAFYVVNDDVLRDLESGAIQPGDLAKMGVPEYALFLDDNEEPRL